ncbi:galactonate dehydratase [Escherichia coli]|uniref:Galactonate dehydratase n=1 Tax=Escherichia coli TaxID=562 RepID=A0A377DDF4_ECOLX|nr:galactonate dehydratase [Escherichia coli]
MVGGDRPADVIDGIKTLREIGFDTFKLNGCEELGLIDNSRAVDAAVNTVAQIREAFGNQIEFGLDFHGRVSAPMAKVLIKELEPYRPLFIEEPVLAEQAEYYPKLAAQTHIPLAAVSACSHVSILNVCWSGWYFDSATGSLSCRRYYRMLQNCRNAEAMTDPCATLSARTDCTGGCLHIDLFPITPYFRNKVWHSLQQRRGVTRLCEKQRRLQYGRRLL